MSRLSFSLTRLTERIGRADPSGGRQRDDGGEHRRAEHEQPVARTACRYSGSARRASVLATATGGAARRRRSSTQPRTATRTTAASTGTTSQPSASGPPEQAQRPSGHHLTRIRRGGGDRDGPLGPELDGVEPPDDVGDRGQRRVARARELGQRHRRRLDARGLLHEVAHDDAQLLVRAPRRELTGVAEADDLVDPLDVAALELGQPPARRQLGSGSTRAGRVCAHTTTAQPRTPSDDDDADGGPQRRVGHRAGRSQRPRRRCLSSIRNSTGSTWSVAAHPGVDDAAGPRGSTPEPAAGRRRRGRRPRAAGRRSAPRARSDEVVADVDGARLRRRPPWGRRPRR